MLAVDGDDGDDDDDDDEDVAGADASDTISIGGNSASAGHESDLAANETMMAVCTSATTWVAINIASNNAVSAATVAA